MGGSGAAGIVSEEIVHNELEGKFLKLKEI